MALSNKIVLRPRFKFELQGDNEIILEEFEQYKIKQSNFIISRIDDHVFIKFPKKEQHFWSPQLHLEINSVEDKKTILNGLFGPNPTVWTLFMFLHFIVAGLFFGFGIWAYTNYTLKTNYTIQLCVVFLMIIIWFVLYLAGRIGRSKGMPEMHLLNDFMNTIVKKYRS
ncbi:GTP-binding protein [Winogradskyella endarachnes]|uniref:GTP-binding protein n=1 Tax=Winogradskyella endarachnes TaxID=2681965 RepID=A0A6L6UG18_9FLAO|nr:GTP-binding protein [Winogradskyella endarachnes]MUU79737.1 GTP-binding protein [Winogradskyella endarachnes]